MRYAAAAVAAAALALPACGGGGGDAKPEAAPTTPAPTQSTVAVAPEAKPVRDAVAKTLAACPCSVDLRAGANDTGHTIVLSGVYDPKTQTAELREMDDGKPTGGIVRVVDGRTFLNPGNGQWIELDFSGLPKKSVSVLVPLAIADPRLSFAVASNVTVATESNTSALGTLHEVEFDMGTAVAATGPSATLMKRLVPEASVYDKLWVRNGLLHRMSFEAFGSPEADDDSLSVTLTVTKTGVAAPNVTEPAGARKVDVATFAP